MTKEELIKELKELKDLGDPEIAHGRADDALLNYINDAEVTDAFNSIEMWYA
jgi:hypothetical protein